MTEQQREAFEKWAESERLNTVWGHTGYLLADTAAAWKAWQAALSHAEGEAVERPLGAAHNGQVFADRVEQEYGFACQAGPISGCYEWQELRKCLGVMVEYIERHPAPQVAVPEAVLALVRFLAQTWAAVDRFVYENCDAAALMRYPVVQGTRNQFNLQAIGEQPFDPALLHAGVEFMLADNSAAPTAPAGEPDPINSRPEAFDEAHQSGGWWKECTGCLEAEDGQAVGTYPYSCILRCHLGAGCDECGGLGALWEEAPTDAQLAALAGDTPEQPVSDPDGLPESPRPMSAAPRDGSMIRLLVQFTENGVNDGFDSGPAWTIGANTYDDSGDDEWHIAGWDWQQDCFTAGEGEPLGWLPMLSAPAPDEREIAAKALESVAVELDTHLWRDAAIRVRGRAASIRSGTDAPSAIRRAVILRTGKQGDES